MVKIMNRKNKVTDNYTCVTHENIEKSIMLHMITHKLLFFIKLKIVIYSKK